MSLDFSVAHASGVFVEASPELGAAAASLADFLLSNKSELSHNNDVTATVRVSHYTQCIAT